MGNGMECMCVSYPEGAVCGSHVGTYSAHVAPVLAPSLSHPHLHQLSSPKESGKSEGWTEDCDQTQSRTSQLRVKPTGQSSLGTCS